MLASAHRAHGGLLHETVAWAYILSMSRITTELNARIGPSGTRVSKAAEKMDDPQQAYIASHSVTVISLALTAERTNPKLTQKTRIIYWT